MKKVLSLMLVLVLVLGMSTVAFAATNRKIVKTSPTHAEFTPVNRAVDYDDLDVTIQSTDPLEYAFEITFTGVQTNAKDSGGTTLSWDSAVVGTYNGSNVSTNGNTGAAAYMTAGQRKDNSITIKTNIKKGSPAIDEVKFTKANVGSIDDAQCLTLALTDTLKSNNDDGVDFEVQSYLVVGGTHWNTKGSSAADRDIVTWGGTLKNKLTEINADYDYFYMGKGEIIKATEYIKSIECGIDEDGDDAVVVVAKMFKDKKYWAVATNDPKNDDEEIMMDKAGIDTVYHLDSVGLASVAEYVLLDEDSSMFVYDGNLKYLGKGGDKLPWSDTYYLAAQQLDVEDEDEPVDEEAEEEGESDPPETSEDLGGDDDYPANVNDNPGTGC